MEDPGRGQTLGRDVSLQSSRGELGCLGAAVGSCLCQDLLPPIVSYFFLPSAEGLGCVICCPGLGSRSESGLLLVVGASDRYDSLLGGD